MRNSKGQFIKGYAPERTHGMSRTPVHRSWLSMLTRCNNPNSISYPRYGGRGIKVCNRWRKFEHFYADMGDRPAGTSLDRINNTGDYEPGNCKWSTPSEQQNNTRANNLLTHNGVTRSLAQWARHTGMQEATIRNRINQCNWSVAEALDTPVGGMRKRKPHKS